VASRVVFTCDRCSRELPRASSLVFWQVNVKRIDSDEKAGVWAQVELCDPCLRKAQTLVREFVDPDLHNAAEDG
jgi:hypothetical protein